jgi:hypothetical protein
MMMIADEASGVIDETFEYAKSSLTGEETVFIMISNPTRVEGYFYNSFNKLAMSFQTLHFNSEESPIVNKNFVNEIITEYGKDSDQYKIRVLGEFPEHGDMDDEGRMDLFDFNKISFITEEQGRFEPTKMGIDPSGEGSNNTPRAVRNEFTLKIVAEQKKSTEKSIADLTISLLYNYDKITPDEVVYDNFGVGANVGTELASAGCRCKGINGAEPAKDYETFENARAEMYRNFRNWLHQ